MLSHIALLLAVLSSASGLLSTCAPSEDLVKTLTMLHNLPSYQHMSSDLKLVATEMVSTAQSCQLTTYLNSIDVHQILDLFQHLRADEAHVLNGYLLQHMKVEKIVHEKLSHMTTASH